MAAGDLTDLATANIAAKIDSPTTTTNAVLATLISAISSQVKETLNTNILAGNYTEMYKGNGKDRILLRQRPVTLVTSIAWLGASYTTAGDLILGTTGITTDGLEAILVNDYFPQHTDIRISYQAGYATTPPDISLAVAELVAEAYARRTHVGETSRSQGGQTTIAFDSREMHAAIKARLMNYMVVSPC